VLQKKFFGVRVNPQTHATKSASTSVLNIDSPELQFFDAKARAVRRKTFLITKDIAGRDYKRLLTTACEHFEFFMLVWRDQFKSDWKRSALKIRRELKPLEVTVRRSNKWPGNIIFGAKADVVFYRFERSGLEVLRRPGSLFSWLTPNYPEDLAFFDQSGRCGMASVTHEHYVEIVDLRFGRSLPNRLRQGQQLVPPRQWKMFLDHHLGSKLVARWTHPPISSRKRSEPDGVRDA
jgi:hypothetical protein